MPDDFDDGILMMVDGNMISAGALMRAVGAGRGNAGSSARGGLEEFPTPSPMHNKHASRPSGSPTGIEMRAIGSRSSADSPSFGTPGSNNNVGGMHGSLSPQTPTNSSFRRSSAIV